MSAGVALTALVLAPLLAGAGTANAAPPLPATNVAVSSITNTAVSSLVVPQTPGAPVAVVRSGDTFTLTAQLVNAKGAPTIVSNNVDTVLELSASGAILAPTAVVHEVVPAKGTTAVFQGLSLSGATGAVVLTVSVVSGSDAALALQPAVTPSFDLVSSIKPVAVPGKGAGTPVSISPNGVGAPCAVGDGTALPQTCAELVAPNGVTSDALFTTAACLAAGCATSRDGLLQVLAGLPATTVKTNPARIIVTCDKSLCANGGVTSFVLKASLSGGGDLAAAPPCKKKNTLNSLDTACVDYVQSTRDNAGDLHLFFLIPFDARMSCC